MELHADFSKPALVHGARIEWVPSPMPGVERRMLDRVGEEVARATTIVRYAPGSQFAPHVHGGGEEFLVLEGVFSDEHGDFGPGTYVRNPPTSRHTPGSEPGCVILVKLWQFDPDDRLTVRLDTNAGSSTAVEGRAGMTRVSLFDAPDEHVAIEQWVAGSPWTEANLGGLEIFVLEGDLRWGSELLERWSWLRLPPGTALEAGVGPAGARVWIKRGHLLAPRGVSLG